MTTGVWPDSIVAGVGSTGQEVAGLPSACAKKSTPGAMSSAEPPLATEATITTPENAAPGLRRVTVERDLALVVRLEQVVDRGHVRHLGLES